MELTADNILSMYMDRELKSVKLKSMKGDDKTIYLRSLSTYEINQWRELGLRYSHRRNMSILTKESDEEKDVEVLCVPELYLIRHCICDSFGKLLFKDADKFNKFVNSVPQELVNEIVFHISEMNIFDSSFDGIEDLKKK
jgi:hypothetical protein